jgi:hypothetical protein
VQAEHAAEEQARKATADLRQQVEGLHARRTEEAAAHLAAAERSRQSEASRVAAVEAELAQERSRALNLEAELQARYRGDICEIQGRYMRVMGEI